MKPVFALTAALTLAGTLSHAAPPPVDRVLNINFDGPKTTLAYWPRDYKSKISFVQGEGVNKSGAVIIAPNGKAGSFYIGYPGWMYTGGFKRPTPGVMTVEFDYKAVGPGTTPAMQLSVAFNKPKGRNGSNGTMRIAIPQPTAEYTHYRQAINVPANTDQVPLTFSFSAASGKVAMDNLKVTFCPDTITLPYCSYSGWVQRGLADTSWNPQYELSGFYNLTEPSKLDTRVRIGSDAKGLYVAFINPDNPADLVANITKNDQSKLWHDDVNSVMLFNPEKNLGWQFMVNSKNVRSDFKMYQKVHGDPWRMDVTGNCPGWQSFVVKNANNWETRFFIPWSAVGVKYKESAKLKINLTREAKGIADNSSFNCGNFGFTVINGWADFNMDSEKIVIKRARAAKELPYTIKRTTKPAAVIKKAPKGTLRSNLWSMHYQPSSLPAAVVKKYSKEELDAYSVQLAESAMAAGSAGPAYPWSMHRMPGKLAKLEEMQSKYGKGMLFSMFSSDTARSARKLNPLYTNEDKFGVDPVDPAFVQAAVNYMNNFVKHGQIERIRKNVAVIRGRDEPSNQIIFNFNRAVNKNKAALDALDAKLKAGYGAGKYGLPAFSTTPDENEQLSRIAFYRWWNDEHRKAMEVWTKVVRKEFPNAIWHVSNANTVSGKSMLDMAMLDDLGDEVSCDPYPTSTKSLYGMERALYHAGFSTKLVADAAPNTRTQAILQAFVYHGGKPGADDMREWASQAMKNGALTIEWYVDRTSLANMFPGYVDMLNIMRQLNDYEGYVPQNKSPKTGVWFSNFDQWAYNDRAVHTNYTLYSILGEKLRSDFRFVFDTHIKLNKARLNELKVLYIPKMGFTDDAIAQALTDWVKNGGRLVIFDPEFMHKKLDGTLPAARKVLTGVDWPLNRRKVAGSKISWQKNDLAVTELKHFPGPAAYPVQAYDMAAPADAKVVATYPDGKPAAIERKVGKGSVVYFAVQPFGNSNLAIAPGKWQNFFAAEAKRAGETTGLAKWDFLLEKAPKVIQLKELK